MRLFATPVLSETRQRYRTHRPHLVCPTGSARHSGAAQKCARGRAHTATHRLARAQPRCAVPPPPALSRRPNTRRSLCARAGQGARPPDDESQPPRGRSNGEPPGGSELDRAPPAPHGRRGRRSGKKGERRAKKPGQFEVEEVSPPPTSLGVHSLPPKTHNGDQLSVRAPGPRRATLARVAGDLVLE